MVTDEYRKMNGDKHKELRTRLDVCYLNPFKGLTVCYYCGDPASTIDHVPPLDFVDAYGSDHCVRYDIDMVKVPSCSECNRHLGNRPLLTLRDRAEFIYDDISRTYKRIIELPDWTADEIDGMGDGMRGTIEEEQVKKQWVESRLTFIKTRL